MDSWLWFWTSDVERCLIWVAALVLPQQDILSASICIFHHAFLDDQTPLTSPTFLCVDLLDYSCFFTTLNTGISKLRYRQVRTAAKSTPETCQIHSKQRKRTVTLKGHQNRDLPSKGFSSSGVFRALSSELLFILESKKKPSLCQEEDQSNKGITNHLHYGRGQWEVVQKEGCMGQQCMHWANGSHQCTTSLPQQCRDLSL